MTLYDHTGKKVRLGPLIGQGGEGEVREVRNHTKVVAKLYHEPISRKKAEKLEVMVQSGSKRLRELSAWPVATLHPSRRGRTLAVGFLMEKIDGHQEIHELYGPGSRKRLFPHARWPFLVHAAANVARAVAAIHDHGHVIGDINHGNFVVSPKATVKLIDCDSFQIRKGTNGAAYVCEVGVAEYTPPELQGTLFSQVIRREGHDAFGLAVLIFQLLFLGRHPFAGNPIGTAQTTLAESIGTLRFAYGKDSKRRGVRQPRATPPLTAASPTVARLFQQSFLTSNPENRPDAKTWITSLVKLQKSLRTCRDSKAHHYYSGLTVCPWCQIEEAASYTIFTVGITVTRKPGSGSFDIARVWAQVRSVSPPTAPAVSPSPRSKKPSFEARKAGYKILFLRLVAIVIGIGGGIAGVTIMIGAAEAVGLVIGMIALGVSAAIWDVTPKEASSIRSAHQQAKREYERMRAKWEAHASPRLFTEKLRELEKAKDDLKNINRWEHEQLKKYNSREYQLQQFLSKHQITTSIEGIGAVRAQALRTHGIKTAADVSYYTVRRISGFGNVLTRNVVRWRSSLERRFVYDPRASEKPKVRARVRKRVKNRRKHLEEQLRQGASELKRLKRQIMSAQSRLLPEYKAAADAYGQAQVSKSHAHL